MDSHKLIYHPERVANWLSGKKIYPIEVEISPSGACNHRCIFCGLDYLEYKPNYLDKDLILKNLKEMKEKGLKSVLVAGEGEPLLNNDTPDIINEAKAYGLDIGMSSNGVLFDKNISEKMLKSLTWVRFSVNAGSNETHKMVHKGKEDDFETAIKNISYAVEYKKKNNLKTTIGVQMLLIPETVKEVVSFAKRLKEEGVDYFTVKPFSKHPQSNCNIDPEFNYEEYLSLEKALNEIKTDKYNIIFRSNSMKKLKEDTKKYDKCYGIPFWVYIDSAANVWPCIAYIGKDKFFYGNLKEKSFVDMWNDERHTEVLEHISKLDISCCRELCRLDSINRYLDELKNPGEHVNFI
jgi:Predicted Fe-S oxidoreductases